MQELSKKKDTPVELYVTGDTQTTPVLRFPMVAYEGSLPRLVRVRSAASGKTLIAGTGLWGNPNMPPAADGVRVGPEVIRRLQRPGESAGRSHKANVRTARLGDLLIHQRGLGAPIALALVLCAFAIGGAVATFLTSRAPAGLALAVLCLGCLASLGTAGKSINDKLRS